MFASASVSSATQFGAPGATAVVYVDLSRAADVSGDELSAEAKVKALRSFGLTASTSGEQSGVHIRLVAG
jgi:phenylalanyl-tRNA synthetase beta subunit